MNSQQPVDLQSLGFSPFRKVGFGDTAPTAIADSRAPLIPGQVVPAFHPAGMCEIEVELVRADGRVEGRVLSSRRDRDAAALPTLSRGQRVVFQVKE